MDTPQPHQAPLAGQPVQPAHQGAPHHPNGAQAAPGPAAAPIAEPAAPDPDSPELAALRMAQRSLDIAGGLVSRVDVLETKVIRVDRQLLMLIGMVAVVSWGVKSLAGKFDAIAAEVSDGAAA